MARCAEGAGSERYEEMTKAATEQIYCRALFETFPIPAGEVQGDDVTPFCKVKVSYRFLPSGFFFPGERSVNLYPPAPQIQREWGVLSLCCSCNTSCRKDVEVNWFQKH